jgi:hypothetical protein
MRTQAGIKVDVPRETIESLTSGVFVGAR